MDARDRYGKEEIKKLAVRLNVLRREGSAWAPCSFVKFFEDDQDVYDKYSTHLFNFELLDDEAEYAKIAARKSFDNNFEVIVFVLEMPFEQVPLFMNNESPLIKEVCSFRLKHGK